MAFIAGVTVIIIPAMVVREYPALSRLYEPPREATRIYARNGELLAVLDREYRQNVPLSEIPKTLQQEVVAMEDQRFYAWAAFMREATKSYPADDFDASGCVEMQATQAARPSDSLARPSRDSSPPPR